MESGGVKSRVAKMPPKLDDDAETVRLNLVAPASWVERINLWRRQQADLPNFSEAVRRLTDKGLETELKKRERKK